ncbi:MAG: hypothetical protein R6W68_13705, partial [Ignavibacteriaceae bacterium]
EARASVGLFRTKLHDRRVGRCRAGSRIQYGQLTGIRIFDRMKANSAVPLSSCLVMDIIKSRNSDK